MTESPSFDALLPAEMARRAEQIGVRKAGADPVTVLLLAVLAGAFIALGALFATTTLTGSSALPYGVARLLGGLAFTLGLTLVIVGGAELFTGNNLIVMAWASRKVPTLALLRNWALVYFGNFIGSVATAALVYGSGQYTFANGQVGATALAIASGKALLPFSQALLLGILCNALVCLAVWLAYSARTTGDRIAAIVLPIAAFVAAGFEHSVANMYFFPIALFIRAGAGPEFWLAIDRSADQFSHLTWERFIVGNLLPVTMGNIVGGALLVGAVYWLAYLRAAPPNGPAR